MSSILEEIDSYFGCGSMSDEEYLEHYGMPRRSGRYPWGSGKEPFQSSRDFLGRVEQMRKNGFTYTDPQTGKKYTGDNAIAKSLGSSSTDFRTVYAIAKDERRGYDVARAQALKKKGVSATEIGRQLGVNESTVRSYLNPNSESRMKQARATAEMLKKHVDEKGMYGQIGAICFEQEHVVSKSITQFLALQPLPDGLFVFVTCYDGKALSFFRRVYAVKSQIEHQYAFFHIYRGVEHRIEPGFLLRFKNTGQYEVVIGMVSQCVNGKNNIHELVGGFR